ncbi:hypothetical protein KRR38_09490 [Novosphingobium sp. G106]|uniref:hypothetical protein n=1 Tax=Novosphingobium sp. G106 TaxID=2849500 RepID=UPI001C2D7A9D|nr:hypothetical protein [Novosphingobium sp. G106]MBV1687901.1 hypothetical protein [Novosphingobium sp. G106]
MKLTLEASLHRIGQMFRERVSPELQSDFAAQSARLAGGLLNICANWVDDAAELRHNENAAIRDLLGEAVALVDRPMATRLAACAAAANPGLKISVLDAENHRLRALLVEVHAAIEMRANPEAQAFNQRIWQVLEEIEQKRAPRE